MFRESDSKARLRFFRYGSLEVAFMKNKMRISYILEVVITTVSLLVPTFSFAQGLNNYRTSGFFTGKVHANGTGFSDKSPKEKRVYYKNLTKSSFSQTIETGNPLVTCPTPENYAPLDGNKGAEVFNPIFKMTLECPMPSRIDILLDEKESAEKFDKLCGCIAENLNPELTPLDGRELMWYGSIGAYGATRACQEINNVAITTAVRNTIDQYMINAVVGTLAAAASDGAHSSCRADLIANNFETQLGAVGGQEKRECSSSATALMMNLLERNENLCAGNDADINCRVKNVTKREYQQVDIKRVDDYSKLMLELGGTTKVDVEKGEIPSKEHKDLSAKFGDYITKSPIGGIYANAINKSLSALMAKHFDAQAGTEVSETNLANLVQAHGDDGKVKIVNALAEYIFSLSDLSPERENFAKAFEIRGFPSLEAIVSGQAELTNEQAKTILSELRAKSSTSCNDANFELKSQCKMISAGVPYQNEKKIDHYCKKPELNHGDILSGSMSILTWFDLIESQEKLPMFKAHTQQALCYQHFKYGGLNTPLGKACDRDERTGVNNNLLEKFKEPETLAQTFFYKVPGPEDKNESFNPKAVINAFDSCAPFAPDHLGDEFEPYDPSDIAKSLADQEKDKNSGRTESITEQVASGVNVSNIDTSSIPSRDNDATRTSAIIDNYPGYGNSGDAMKQIQDDARNNAIANATSSQTEAESFYSQYGQQQLDNLAREIGGGRSPAAVDDGLVNVDAPSEVAETPQQQLQNLDEVLAKIRRLEEENSKLFAQLQERGVKEVKDEKGNTVSVEDAFNKIQDRIAKQREDALAERKRLQDEIKNNSKVAHVETPSATGNRGNLGSDGFNRPSFTPTPGSQGSIGSYNNNRVANIGNTFGPTVGNAGQGSGNGQTFGPFYASSNGLVLSQEALDLARPDLKLGDKKLADSVDLVKQAIDQVKSEMKNHNLQLPPQKVDGVEVTDYILQEENGKTMMVYVVDGKVVVKEIDVALEKVAEVKKDDAPQEEVVEQAPVIDPGRKAASWEEAVQLMIQSGANDVNP